MRKKTAKKKKKTVLIIMLLTIATIIIAILLSAIFYSYYIIAEVKELYTRVKVENIIGFDVNRSALIFGIVPRGAKGQRSVSLHNRKDEPLMVHIEVNGNISDWIYASENDFTMEANEKKEINFSVIPSKDAEFGTYDGRVRFIFKRLFP